jgi:type VI secretion system protein ImpH
LVDFVPRAVQLAEPQRMRLGTQNHQLGRDAHLGRRLTGPADALRVVVGPVDRATFETFLPGAPARHRLHRLIDDVSGGLLEAEVEIELQPGEEPRTRLGSAGGRAGTLGRDALIRRVSTAAPLRVRIDLTNDAERLRLTE